MSRITRARIEPGDSLTATDLNNRYSDYTQTNLNLDNVADGSIDSQQLPSGSVLKAVQQTELGTGDVQHTSDQTITRKTSGSAAATVVAPAAGFALNGTSGFTLATNDVLRVYITYQCRSLLNSLDPNNTGAVGLGTLTFQERFATGSSTTVCNLGAMAWMFQLKWDITSSSLGAFANLPNQGSMLSVWSSSGGSTSKYGDAVTNLDGTAFIPAWWSGGMYWQNGRHDNAIGTDFGKQNTGWRTVTLTWVYQNTGSPVTVYGLQTVAHGLFHPYNHGGDNGIVLDTATYASGNPTLQVGIGNAVVMHMRGA